MVSLSPDKRQQTNPERNHVSTSYPTKSFRALTYLPLSRENVKTLRGAATSEEEAKLRPRPQREFCFPPFAGRGDDPNPICPVMAAPAVTGQVGGEGARLDRQINL